MKSDELTKRHILILSNCMCFYKNEIWHYIKTKTFGFSIHSLSRRKDMRVLAMKKL
jgi:hypothetical protein